MYHPSMVKLPNAAFYIVAKMPLRKKASYIKMLRTILLGYLIN